MNNALHKQLYNFFHNLYNFVPQQGKLKTQKPFRIDQNDDSKKAFLSRQNQWHISPPDINLNVFSPPTATVSIEQAVISLNKVSTDFNTNLFFTVQNSKNIQRDTTST